MATTDTITLEVDGVEYEGFESISVERNIEQKASTFNVSAFDSKDSPARTIAVGKQCTIRHNTKNSSEVVITGYIEKKEIAYDSGSHTISFSGRSVSSNILGSSPIDCPSQFINATNIQIARQLVKPFGVSLTIDSDVEEKLLMVYELDQQDSIESLLEKLFVDQDVFIHDLPSGALRITKGSNKSTNSNKIVVSPKKGESNVLSATYSEDISEIMNSVEVIAQAESTDEDFGTKTAQIKGVYPKDTLPSFAASPEFSRPRVLRQAADKAQNQEEAEEEARKEYTRRLSERFTLTYTLQGWRGSANWLWWENEVVQVDDEMLGTGSTSRTWMITGVSYSMNTDSGTTVTLTLKMPETFQSGLPNMIPSIGSILDNSIYGEPASQKELRRQMEDYLKKFPDHPQY